MYSMYSLSIWAFAHSTSHTPTKALVGGGGAGHSRDGSSRGKRAPYDRPRAHSHTLAGFFLLPILKCFIFFIFYFYFFFLKTLIWKIKTYPPCARARVPGLSTIKKKSLQSTALARIGNHLLKPFSKMWQTQDHSNNVSIRIFVTMAPNNILTQKI